MKQRSKNSHSARERKWIWKVFWSLTVWLDKVLEEKEKGEIKVTAAFLNWLGEGLHNQKSKQESKFKRKSYSFLDVLGLNYQKHINISSLMCSWHFGLETLEMVIIFGCGGWSLAQLTWVTSGTGACDWIMRRTTTDWDVGPFIYINKWRGLPGWLSQQGMWLLILGLWVQPPYWA